MLCAFGSGVRGDAFVSVVRLGLISGDSCANVLTISRPCAVVYRSVTVPQTTAPEAVRCIFSPGRPISGTEIWLTMASDHVPPLWL